MQNPTVCPTPGFSKFEEGRKRAKKVTVPFLKRGPRFKISKLDIGGSRLALSSCRPPNHVFKLLRSQFLLRLCIGLTRTTAQAQPSLKDKLPMGMLASIGHSWIKVIAGLAHPSTCTSTAIGCFCGSGPHDALGFDIFLYAASWHLCATCSTACRSSRD